MPLFEFEDFALNYQIEGNEAAPWLILSNSLGTEMDLWAPQIADFSQHFRVLRYDSRGHGESDVTPGPYSVAQLGGDILALMDHLSIERAHFCGLSLGGATGIWLAKHHPNRISRLVLANTGAKIGTETLWNTRMEVVNSAGLQPITALIIDRWFTAGFQQRDQPAIEKVLHMVLRTATTGYTASCAALRDFDMRAELDDIQAPTLVITGTHDTATPPSDGAFLVSGIAHAQLLELDAAHLSNWEQPSLFSAAVTRFLTAIS